MTHVASQTAALRRSPRLFKFIRVRLSRKLWGTYRIRLCNIVSRALGLLLIGIGLPAWAGPTGGQVVSGQAQISTPTAQSTVVNQATQKAVINWQSFGIAGNESVQFIQPSSTSVVLNRIVGSDASRIFGSLSANGQVFLVNPQGVYFAPTARVDTGALLATSLSLSDADFSAGRYRFGGMGTGEVRNEGSISVAPGGYVLLASPHVSNSGTITANNGSVALLAGSRVTVDVAGDRLVSYSIDEAALQATVTNAGSIQADGGAVALMANTLGGALATAVNHSGVIRANSVAEHNGVVTLRAIGGDTVVSGGIDVSAAGAGQTGGSVKVLGDRVGLFDRAAINASGAAGGGTVLVGGGEQGKGTEQNASAVFMSSNAVINADAIAAGKGGKVVLWSDGFTSAHGTIYARGGGQGGDGGLIETSGHQILDATGVRGGAYAPKGKAGSWLFDPDSNVDITSSASSGGAFDGSNNWIPTADGSTILNTTISGLLTGGTTVTVTTANATGSELGNITVSAPITAAGAATLSLTAGTGGGAGSVFVNQAITGSGAALNVNLVSGTGGGVAFGPSGSLSTTGGNAVITANTTATIGAITTAGGSVTATAQQGMTLNGAVNASAGTVTLSTAGGALALGANTVSGVGVSLNGVGVTSTGGTVDGGSGDLLVNGGAGAINLAGALTTMSNTATAVTVRNATTAALGNITTGATGTTVLGVGGDITGAVTQTGVITTGTLTGSTGTLSSVTLGGANVLTNLGAFAAGAGLSVTDSTLGLNVTGAVNGGTGPTSITTAGGALAVTGSVTGVGATLVTTSGNIALGGNVDAGAGTATLTSAGDIGRTAGTVSGVAVTLDAAGGIGSIAAPVFTASTGTLTLTSAGVGAAGDITVTEANALNTSRVTLATAATAQTVTINDTHAGGITVGKIIGDAALNDNLTLDAVIGKITEGTGVVRGNNVTLDSATGVGTGTGARVNTAATTLAARSTTSGGVFVSEADAVTLNAIGGVGNSAAGGAAYEVTAGGPVTVSGAITTAANGNIDVRTTAGALNVNAVVTALGSGNVTLIAGDLLTANAAISSGTGNLSLTGGTGVTHTAAGNLTTGGAGSISVTATTGNVSMADGTVYSAGSGQVDVVAAGNVVLGQITTGSSTVNVTATAGAITDNTTLESANIATSGTATLVAATGIGSAGGAADINTAVGTLAATNTSSGNIVVNQANDLVIGGAGVRTLGGNGNIDVRTTAGALDVNSVVTSNGSGNVTLNAAGLLTANAAISSGTGNLSLTGGTGITQTAGFIQAGGTTLLAAGNGAITLDSATNDFVGVVTATGGAVTLKDANDLTVALTAGGVGTLTSVAGKVMASGTAASLIATGTDVTSAVATVGASTLNASGAGSNSGTVGGDLAITAVGTAGNTGAVTGSANLTSTGNAAVTNAANVGGTLITQGGATTVSGNLGALNTTGTTLSLGTTQVAGNASMTATGAVTQAAPNNTFGVTGTTTINAAGQAVTLGNAGNDFGAAVTVKGGPITVHDINALSIASLTLGANTALDLRSGGTLTLASGPINSGTADLTLVSGGALATTGNLAGQNVTLSGVSGVTLSHNVTAGGNLLLTSTNSAIAQVAGNVSATGTTTINAGTGDVTLTGANNFGGTATVTGANVSLNDTNDLTAVLTASGNSTLVAAGNLTVSGITVDLSTTTTGANHSTSFGTTTVGGNLTTVSTGAVGQTGALAVTGTSGINAGTGDVTLTGANNFGGTATVTGANVSLNDTNDLTAVLTASGNSTLVAAGNLAVSGTTVDLSTTTTGANHSTSFGDPTVGGNLTTVSTGAVGQTGALVVAGTTSINAAGQTVTLDMTDNRTPVNNFGGEVKVSADTLVFKNFSNAVLDISGVTNTATITTAGTAIGLNGDYNGKLLTLNALITDSNLFGLFTFIHGEAPYVLGANVQMVTTHTLSGDPLKHFSAVSGSTVLDNIAFDVSNLERVLGGTSGGILLEEQERRERERRAGIGRLKDGVRQNSIRFEDVIAPLVYKTFEVQSAPCAKEQAANTECKK